MPVPWDDKAEKDLLLAIIDEGALKSIAWASISERMTSLGYSFSLQACRQHYQKIRKQSTKGSASGTLRGSASATPRKRSKTSNSTNKNNLFAADQGGINEDDEENWNSPSKKRVKKEKKEELDDENNPRRQGAPYFKGEPGEIIDLNEGEGEADIYGV